MRTLELENYGVCEISNAEMKETDGGLVWFLVAGACLLLASCQSGNGNVMQVGGASNKAHTSADSSSSTSSTHAHVKASMK
ncbi:hypothetical protein [Runella slithyformis]|uniref:Uncharacterized protein n=1 Tax=Runella slithyformis (strain ATCC 29530 / DSM 19594 / LMG 11500 / NCIMB 11436 / LSU 4) TaxID=761193 RepID=A0A7U3ZNL1_RUNSL|nr:hypothetical protein [Runella slithyformis]AEI50393.1 hypothetical protein Runsl_4042 [Runella slithyformis DSM 19594]